VLVAALDTDGLRRGSKIGRYKWSLLCGAPAESVFWLGRGTMPRTSGLTRSVREALRAEGVETLDADERSAARIKLSGRLKSVDMTLCRVPAMLADAPRSVSGRARVEIDWTVRRIASDASPSVTTTTGEAALSDGVPDGGSVVVESAIVEATRALARSDAFLATTGPSLGSREIDRAVRTPGVGRRLLADMGGWGVEGIVTGRSHRPDTGKPVILLDFAGRAVHKGAPIRDAAGRVVARALGDGARWNQAAWIGLVPAEVERDETDDGIDPTPPGPTYQPEPDENDPNGPD